MTIGAFLEKLRLSCGYSLRQAANITKLSHGYIRDVEKGDNRTGGVEIIPMPRTLKKFAEAYGVTYEELMRLAGHISANTTESEYENIDLSTILFIEVDLDSNLLYHKNNLIFKEKKPLYDYILFEDKLELNDFLRVKNGTYVNLNKIVDFDKENIIFDCSDTTIRKTLNIKTKKIAKILSHSVKKNKMIKNNLTDGTHPLDFLSTFKTLI